MHADFVNQKVELFHQLGGGATGTMSLLFAYSLVYATTKLVKDSKGNGQEPQYNVLVDDYMKTLKFYSIQSLHRGFNISAVGIFICHGLC